jgi:hypothetical protein
MEVIDDGPNHTSLALRREKVQPNGPVTFQCKRKNPTPCMKSANWSDDLPPIEGELFDLSLEEHTCSHLLSSRVLIVTNERKAPRAFDLVAILGIDSIIPACTESFAPMRSRRDVAACGSSVAVKRRSPFDRHVRG